MSPEAQDEIERKIGQPLRRSGITSQFKGMQPSSPPFLTCPTCGATIEETFGAAGSCMFCLLQAGIGSVEEAAQDSTADAFGGGMRFGVYEIDCHADGSLCELGRGAMGRSEERRVGKECRCGW